MGERFIVLVDDAPEVEVIVRRALKDRPYEIRFLQDGREALEAVRSRPTDLVLLDINMPELNGFEVCRRLKADELTRDIPVALFTQWDRVMDIATGLQAGADYFFSKETNEADLAYRVEDIFNTWASGDSDTERVTTDLQAVAARNVPDIFRALEDAFNNVVERTVTRAFGQEATRVVFQRAVRAVSRTYRFVIHLLRDGLWLEFGRLDPELLQEDREHIVAGFAAFVGEVLRLLRKLTGSEFVLELQAQMEKKLTPEA